VLGFLFTPYRTVSNVSVAAEESAMQLNRRIESLELACAGLWELLKTKHGYSDDELVSAVRAVDMRDGVADHKLKVADEICPNCGRQLLSRQSPNCSWCGADLGRIPF
jgi:hypothetical protein